MERNREHFSWSQYTLWHSSKRAFWKKYDQEQKDKSNKFFAKGEELATYMEDGTVPDFCEDEMLPIVAAQIPRLDLPEGDLDVRINDTVILKCFMDSLAAGNDDFLEYKTGKEPWDQNRVDLHEQLIFYAVACWFENGQKVVPKCRLVWIETMETDEGLRYTGRVEIFHRTFKEKELIKFAVRIIDTLTAIENYEYKEYQVSDKKAKRYAHLTEVIEEMEAERIDIKAEMHVEMRKAGATFGANSIGNFIISQRKSWRYTVNLLKNAKEIKKLQADLKKEQILEQRQGLAVSTINETIMFKLNK